MLANDDVKQDYAGLFALDPIGRAAKWRTTMLADPSHVFEISKGRAMAIAGQSFGAGENCKEKKVLACTMLKSFLNKVSGFATTGGEGKCQTSASAE